MIKALKPCETELIKFPESVREDLADLLIRLDFGQTLSLPISRPMPSIGKRVHELRLSDRGGEFRVIYLIAGQGNIWLIHAFKKQSEKTSKKDIQICKSRLKQIL